MFRNMFVGPLNLRALLATRVVFTTVLTKISFEGLGDRYYLFHFNFITNIFIFLFSVVGVMEHINKHINVSDILSLALIVVTIASMTVYNDGKYNGKYNGVSNSMTEQTNRLGRIDSSFSDIKHQTLDVYRLLMVILVVLTKNVDNAI